MLPKEVRNYSVTLMPTTVEEGSSTFELGEHTIRLRRFQEEVMRAKSSFILKAPTGAGKTLTLLLRREEGKVGIYPSKALVNDQYASIAGLLETSCSCVEDKGVMKVFDCGKRKFVIAKITSESMEGGGWKSIENLCKRVLEFRDEGFESITFTVPEYPYLLLSGTYDNFYRVGVLLKALRRMDLAKVAKTFKLSRERVVMKKFCAELLFSPFMFFDEFHAYSSKSLYGALALLIIYTSMPFIGTKVAISSATETKEFKLAKEIIEEYEEIEAKPGKDVVRGETELELNMISFVKPWPGAARFAQVEGVVPEIVQKKMNEIKEVVKRGKKAIIIVDRIATVYEIYKKVVKEINDVVCVTSMKEELNCSGDPREASVIVGNEAISYGVDIKDLDYGIITAKLWFQFVQRIGRLGRGSQGSKAIAVLPEVARPKEALEWGEFVEWSKEVFPERPVDWFEASGLEKTKVENVVKAHELMVYIAFRDKFGVSRNIKMWREKLSKKLNLIRGRSKEMYLGAESTFLFSAFRGSSDDIIIKARNFELDEEGKPNPDRPIKGFLAVEISSKEAEEFLDRIHDKVLQLNVVLSGLKGYPKQIMGKKANPLPRQLVETKDPVYLIRSNEGYMRYLLSVEDSIAVVEPVGKDYKILGVLVRA